MSLSKDVQEFAEQHGSWQYFPQPWQPPFRQTSMLTTINDNANFNDQEWQQCPSGKWTAVNRAEGINRRLSNRRRRQRERRSQWRRSKRGEELGQEMSPELEWDQFSQKAVNVLGYGQGPGEEQYTQPLGDFYMPIESTRDVYFP